MREAAWGWDWKRTVGGDTGADDDDDKIAVDFGGICTREFDFSILPKKHKDERFAACARGGPFASCTRREVFSGDYWKGSVLKA